jgi:methylenetetrahydrofolate dehydrogenase (NADP+)/methenyltetrahydrofolate cyclohydrolase
MSARIIDGKAIAETIKGEVRQEAARLRSAGGPVPGLAFILVGENPASQSYVTMKGKACQELGFFSVTERLPATTDQASLLSLIDAFNRDLRIHGILVQLPLPAGMDEGAVLRAVDYRKDVDGFHPVNAGLLMRGEPCLKPCTPSGILELLSRSGTDTAGRHVVVAGRSNIVGKPVANMLLQKERGANAVVTVAHTGAGDLSAYTRQADIVIAAIGKPELITGKMLKPGAVVIDVGINRVDDPGSPKGYRMTGDVHFASAREVASAITPVPGGVGPMTIAMLMKNTLQAASSRS